MTALTNAWLSASAARLQSLIYCGLLSLLDGVDTLIIMAQAITADIRPASGIDLALSRTSTSCSFSQARSRELCKQVTMEARRQRFFEFAEDGRQFVSNEQ